MLSKRQLVEVLLVEDNDADADLTVEAFSVSKLVNEITIVKDGVEALAYLRRQGQYSNSKRPSLILLDLNMPRKNGLEVLAEIKQDGDLCDIPVVVLTTSKEDQDILRTYKHQANCYITKPLELGKFMAVVKAIDHFWFEVVELPSPA